MPIIEPEVLPDGKHTIEECARATQRVRNTTPTVSRLLALTFVRLLQTLAAVIKYCHDFNVLWEGALLKPNMVLPGSDSGVKASPQDVAHYTVTVLARTVPAALPGIMVRLVTRVRLHHDAY